MFFDLPTPVYTGIYIIDGVLHAVHILLQGVSITGYASAVLATIGMSVCLSVRPSVRHTLALSENDAS